MYGFLKPHKGEHRSGRYYPTVPELPLTDPGTHFRFAYASANDTVEDVVESLEHKVSDVVITTTYNLGWSCDGAVLIERKLYKIQDGIQCDVLPDQSNAIARTIRKRYTIRLREIDNPIGLEVL